VLGLELGAVLGLELGALDIEGLTLGSLEGTISVNWE